MEPRFWGGAVGCKCKRRVTSSRASEVSRRANVSPQAPLSPANFFMNCQASFESLSVPSQVLIILCPSSSPLPLGDVSSVSPMSQLNLVPFFC